MNVSFFITKDYENQPLRRLPENKPNQTQFVYSSYGRKVTADKGLRIYAAPAAREKQIQTVTVHSV